MTAVHCRKNSPNPACAPLLAGLSDVSAILANGSGRRETLVGIFDALERHFGLTRGTVLLMTAGGDELFIEAAKPSADGRIQDARYRRGEGISGRVLASGESVVIDDISTAPEFKDRIHQRKHGGEGPVGFICVPISVHNEPVGTLAADLSPDASVCLQEGEKLLSIVAGMLAHDVATRRMMRLEREALEQENEHLREVLSERIQPENMIGRSDEMKAVFARVHRVAPTDTTVLIRGESGTGKELVASAIHYGSERRNGTFMKVNCAALSEALLESELFGHEKGAFTGALQARAGRIEESEGGTLFLDEIGDFAPTVQVKLLRVLQERTFERVGSNAPRHADVRIIAATNKDLERAVQDGTFREDFYYRINVFAIHMPPLRHRKGDILLLANHFVEKYAAVMDKHIRRISTPAINMLVAYHWPGNVRELENCIEHAVLMANDDTIHGHDLPPTMQFPEVSDAPAPGTLKQRVMVLEREFITDALKRHSGNVSAAARELGITARMVRYKIKNLQIDEGLVRRRKKTSSQ